jgi:hypothetical protein
MNSWARRYGQLFAQWHLLGTASTGAINRGILTAACGENLGDEEAMLERVHVDAVVENRCPVCRAIAPAGSADRSLVDGGLRSR